MPAGPIDRNRPSAIRRIPEYIDRPAMSSPISGHATTVAREMRSSVAPMRAARSADRVPNQTVPGLSATKNGNCPVGSVIRTTPETVINTMEKQPGQ
jgi:hypothetical protein